jgi:hypothetical protein
VKKIFLLIFPFVLFGGDCVVNYKMLYAIAQNERHKKRDIGYPYLISFNHKNDRFKLKTEHRKWMLDNRTLDCRSQKLCTEVASYLLAQGVRNMDMGPFQICYKFHGKKMPLENFFKLNESFAFAKDYTRKLVDRYGCTWEALARYHSGTKKLNLRYARGLKNAYYSN